MKKFKLTTNTRLKYGRTLIQIQATVSFGSVTKGDLGGWVENEASLGDDTWAWQEAEIFKDAVISGGVIRGGVISGGEISGGEIRGGVISGGVIRGGVISGGVIRGGVISGGEISGGEIRGGEISGGVIRGGVISGGEIRGGEIRDAVISGGVIRGGEISGGVISGGVIKKTSDYIAFCSIGSAGGVLAAYRTKTGIELTRGCFKGTIKEFEAAVKNTHKTNNHAKEYALAIKLIKLRFAVKVKTVSKKAK